MNTCVSVSSIVPRRAPIVLPLGRVTGCDTISGSGKKGSPLGHASACASETLAPSATTRAGRATPQRRATARPNVITESHAADRAGTERRGCVRSLDMTSSLEWQWISYRSNEPAVVRHRRGSDGLARDSRAAVGGRPHYTLGGGPGGWPGSTTIMKPTSPLCCVQKKRTVCPGDAPTAYPGLDLCCCKRPPMFVVVPSPLSTAG